MLLYEHPKQKHCHIYPKQTSKQLIEVHTQILKQNKDEASLATLQLFKTE
jgi:hypothetical protein